MHTEKLARGLCGWVAVLVLWACPPAARAGSSPTVPFQLELEEVRSCPPLPAVHSFIAALYNPARAFRAEFGLAPSPLAPG